MRPFTGASQILFCTTLTILVSEGDVKFLYATKVVPS